YSPIIKNFQVGLSGYAIYKIASSPLGPEGPYQNRYELALFDVSDPHNTEDLDRLEDLYLRYYLFEENKSYAQIGKFHLKTPLVNLQDGRMRPNLQEGTWLEFNELDKVKIKAGWLWATSPRGTVKWYSMGESVGVYPNGKAVNGNKAQYAGNVNTRNVLIAALSLKPTKDLTYQLWNYYADNLFNISLHKFELKKEKPHATIYAGMQYLWQQSLYNDTLAIEKQYITQAEQSHSFSGRLSVTNKHSGEEWNLNYTRITSHGRFLFPREWGVESFYIFMQRERMEGMGDVHAVMVQNNHGFDKHKQLSLHSSAGIFLLPEVDNARINKYAMPSFYQVNLRMSYKFSGFLQGLQTDVLYLYKGNLQNSIAEVPAFYHNKVDMHHLSVVLDYYF
ncbi:MAG TPA: OprD family outer membrane porin, partial [Cyclobacteriaceae bacterium]|nr:OprD family outer membrane porin [Cyclobacteriaceae bacterium]